MAIDRPDTPLATISLLLGDHADVTSRSHIWFEFDEPAAMVMRRIASEQARYGDVVAASDGKGQEKSKLAADYWQLATRAILDVALCGKSIPSAYVETVKDAAALAVGSAYPAVRNHFRYVVSIQRDGGVFVYCVDGASKLLDSKKIGSLTVATGLPDVREKSKVSHNDDHQKTPLGILFGGLAFAFGFVAVAAIEGLLLLLLGAAFDRNLSPRGLGWIVLPILGGLACATAVPKTRAELNAFGSRLKPRFSNMNLFLRRALAGTIAWLATMGTYYLAFDPFGGYMSAEDGNQILKVMVLPPLIGVSAAWCIMQLLRERN